AGLLDGALGIVGQARGDLDGDVAVERVGLVVNRPEDVGGAGYIFDEQRLIYLVGTLAGLDKPLYGRIVVGRPRYGLLEYGGVSGDPHHAVLIDQALQLAGGDQPPA